jgi:hypothetical protein
MKKTIDVRYQLGHVTTKDFDLTDYFCPQCGNKSVWVEDSEGDYYEGPQFICTHCESSFRLPRIYKIEDMEDRQIVKELKD